MRKTDIKRYLKDYSIYKNRKTTINHAFASSLSITDKYDDSVIDRALKILGQNPNLDLKCAYCDKPAETWDHIKAIVKAGSFSGFGHQIGNLLPCCKNCNSKKGNKNWLIYLKSIHSDTDERQERITRIEAYISQNTVNMTKLLSTHADEIKILNDIRDQVISLLKKGDEQAKKIRDAMNKQQ